jgi:copper(I)-binding protein
MNVLTKVFTLLVSTLLSFSVLAELVVDEGYVRKPIPGRSMSAAFMTINNTGAADVVLKTAAIEGASSVEMHTHTHKDGVMRMRQLHELTIKAGGSVVLEPGGLHLMIFGIKKLPENPQLTLCDELEQCAKFPLAVRKLVQ